MAPTPRPLCPRCKTPLEWSDEHRAYATCPLADAEGRDVPTRPRPQQLRTDPATRAVYQRGYEAGYHAAQRAARRAAP